MREDWVLVIEDLEGAFEIIKWFEDESIARTEFDEWIGEDESNPNYPDGPGRDCLLLHVVARGADRWEKYLHSLRKTARNET